VKLKLLLLVLAIPFAACAVAPSTVAPRNAYIIATGGSPIPVSYGLGATSRVLSGLTGFRHMSVINTTGCGIMVNTASDSVAPADGSENNIPLVDSGTSLGESFDDLYIAGSVYIRANCSPSAPITSGSVIIKVW
jgi:hypothetical protein